LIHSKYSGPRLYRPSLNLSGNIRLKLSLRLLKWHIKDYFKKIRTGYSGIEQLTLAAKKPLDGKAKRRKDK
jgi:hypothetical protein